MVLRLQHTKESLGKYLLKDRSLGLPLESVTQQERSSLGIPFLSSSVVTLTLAVHRINTEKCKSMVKSVYIFFLSFTAIIYWEPIGFCGSHLLFMVGGRVGQGDFLYIVTFVQVIKKWEEIYSEGVIMVKTLPVCLEKVWVAEESWNWSAKEEKTIGENVDLQLYLHFWLGPYFRDLWYQQRMPLLKFRVHLFYLDKTRGQQKVEKESEVVNVICFSLPWHSTCQNSGWRPRGTSLWRWGISALAPWGMCYIWGISVPGGGT